MLNAAHSPGNDPQMPMARRIIATTQELIPTRHSLLRRMKDWGDRESWEEFFRIYWKLIYGVATKAGLTEAEAQDVVQETIMNVAKNIKQFEVGSEHGSFQTWLLNNTRWRIADQLRRRLPTLPHSAEADETTRTSILNRLPDPESLEFEKLWEQDWKENLTGAAIANLKGQVDPLQYQMFDLHVL